MHVCVFLSSSLVSPSFAGDNFGTVKIWHRGEQSGAWVEGEVIPTTHHFVLPKACRPADISHATGDNVGGINISFSQDNDILVFSRGDGMIGGYRRDKSSGLFAKGFLASVVAHQITRCDGLVEVFAEILSDSTTILSVGDSYLRVWDLLSKDKPFFVAQL